MKTRSQSLKEIQKEVVAQFEKTSNALSMVNKYSNNSMYSLEEMVSTNYDYTTIKGSFEKTTLEGFEINISKIYRVRRRLRARKSDNLLLFHGTNSQNALGILEEGFKPSTGGKYGPGVYLTDCSSCAGRFSARKVAGCHDDLNDNLLFIFVNEIFESESLEEIVVKKELASEPGTFRKNQFEHYIKEGTAKKHSVKSFEKDSGGRKIKSCASSEEEFENYYVCDEKLVIPRYLIQCFPVVFVR